MEGRVSRGPWPALLRGPNATATVVALGLWLLVASASLPGVERANATPTVIRTGGPSAPFDAKVAVVASERNLGGARFRVTPEV